MTKELEEDIEHELKWMNSPCRATREEARANLFKIINNQEKENAELKEQNRSLLESCEGATMMYKDLCKAKEIIKYLLSFIQKENYRTRWDINIAEAE